MSGKSPLAALVEQIVQHVAELPDRTSPDNWPEAMLVTGDELQRILQSALQGVVVDVAVPQMVEQFRSEVQDKLGVVYNGCHALPTHRAIARQQCEDFLVDLYAKQVARADHAEAALKDWREWAQFVYLDGGKVTLDDKALKEAMCVAHDKAVADAMLQPRKEADALIDRIGAACGFPIVENREQVTETICKCIARLKRELTDAEAALKDWFNWAQFVFLGGGPITREGQAQRLAVCAAVDQLVAEVAIAAQSQLTDADAEITTLRSLLEECAEVLDNYSDVNDGDDGQPVANRAMALLARVNDVLDPGTGTDPQ